MHTENPGHEVDHQELGSVDEENYSAGLDLLPFSPLLNAPSLFPAE